MNALPVKGKKISLKKRWFYYLVLEYKSKIVIRQRTTKDIWQGLYEFPLIETTSAAEPAGIIKQAVQLKWLKTNDYTIKTISPLYKQQLSHQHITGQFILLTLKTKPVIAGNWQWIAKEALHQYAFPRILRHFLRDELPQKH